MSVAQVQTASSTGVLWWWDTGHSGLIGYFGKPSDGLHWMRHAWGCKPGMWAVGITGWDSFGKAAVVDDFGNLVEVKQ